MSLRVLGAPEEIASPASSPPFSNLSITTIGFELQPEVRDKIFADLQEFFGSLKEDSAPLVEGSAGRGEGPTVRAHLPAYAAGTANLAAIEQAVAARIRNLLPADAPSTGQIVLTSLAPGQILPLDNLNPLPPLPPGETELLIGVFLPAPDTLRLRVALNVVKTEQMIVGLATEVWWAKEIVAWSNTTGRTVSVFSENHNTNPNFMTIDQSQVATIVFRKPVLFPWWWWDLANLDQNLFWTVFGGHRLTFTWVRD